MAVENNILVSSIYEIPIIDIAYIFSDNILRPTGNKVRRSKEPHWRFSKTDGEDLWR